jgi:hypothetical protein
LKGINYQIISDYESLMTLVRSVSLGSFQTFLFIFYNHSELRKRYLRAAKLAMQDLEMMCFWCAGHS